VELAIFSAPPVVETVLSVQFSRLKTYSLAYAGWFWKQYLDERGEWPKSIPVPRLPDVFERFDESESWSQFPFALSIQMAPERLQIVRKDQQRMIQVQDSRFVLNWKKQEQSEYPTFGLLLPEFNDHFDKFTKFCQTIDNESLDINQWEVTYVNIIEKGSLWNSVDDWKDILPGLFIPQTVSDKAEAFQGEWKYLIAPQVGRLYISIKHIRVGGPNGQEALMLQLVARGPVTAQSKHSLEDGFNLGHETIVSTFEKITSKEARKTWKQRGLK